MSHHPMSRALLAGAALLSFQVGPAPARADIIYETGYFPTSSYIVPTSGIFGTSYVVPTSSVLSDSYVVPTTYLPTSSIGSVGDVLTTSSIFRTSYRYRPRRYVERTTYLAPTSYSVSPTSYVVPTSYLLPTSFVVPTSYLLPTSYVVPTTFATSSFLAPTSYVVDSGVVTTSGVSSCCDSAPAASVRPSVPRPSTSAPAAGSNSGGATITSEPSASGAAGAERRPSGTVDDGSNSNVSPPVPAPGPVPAPAAPKAASTPRDPGPLPQPGPIDAGAPPAPAGGAGDVQLPPPGQTGAQPPADETAFRKSQRPAYDTRNILRGRVVAFDSGRPEEGVSVIVSSRSNGFTDRPAMTDADGEFKVSLPDGDWTVKVRMPSGTVYPVGRDFLTASSGKILDGSGRIVREFLITR